jgi:hypothetical protein
VVLLRFETGGWCLRCIMQQALSAPTLAWTFILIIKAIDQYWPDPRQRVAARRRPYPTESIEE